MKWQVREWVIALSVGFQWAYFIVAGLLTIFHPDLALTYFVGSLAAGYLRKDWRDV